ncbi:MAG: hypothetical protein UT32_C0017G0014 [Parcubacteria group bacterium GW2011_GWC2_39_14]|nr:MAG: hypothetical protein UT32_C0017G0014 [Parcubacteria group bacterium GW2011_GWC2_39_14]KKR54341.1 MAG: hypothetical protein UT91_C0018G0015 [Parcubacteria group bacterium GW2011_GWA2_40_23]
MAVLPPAEASKFLPQATEEQWTLRYAKAGLVVDYNDEGQAWRVHTFPGFNTLMRESGEGIALTNNDKVPQLDDAAIEKILSQIAGE